jgi:hypothetical protein
MRLRKCFLQVAELRLRTLKKVAHAHLCQLVSHSLQHSTELWNGSNMPFVLGRRETTVSENGSEILFALRRNRGVCFASKRNSKFQIRNKKEIKRKIEAKQNKGSVSMFLFLFLYHVHFHFYVNLYCCSYACSRNTQYDHAAYLYGNGSIGIGGHR